MLRRLFLAAALLSTLVVGGARSATLSFQPQLGRDHIIEVSQNLLDWSPVGLPIRGEGGAFSVPIELGPGSSFYRVQLVSPYSFDRLSVQRDPHLQDLKTAYESSGWQKSAVDVLKRTVPDAAWIVEADADSGFFGFWFNGVPADFSQLMMSLSTAVHETVHHLGFKRIGFQNGRFVYSLALGRDAFYTVPALGLFPRSEIVQSLPVELQSMGYVDTYLRGQSGAQDLVTLLDELNAYTFSVLVDAATVDFMTGLSARSTRDGVLAMMLFVETYLRVARVSHPADYEKILSSSAAELVVVLWDRAEGSLAFAGADPRLGIQDRQIRSSVMSQENLSEIERIRSVVSPRVVIAR